MILAGVELNTPHSRYGYLEVDDIDGWFNAPATKQQQVARINADGDFPAPSYYESRYITIAGALATSGAAERWTGADMISALLSRQQGLLTVKADGVTQWAMVERTDQPEIEVVAHQLIEYQLKLKATDPYKYGEAREVELPLGSSETAFHRGTEEAWPVVTVTGSAPGGYTLDKGGRQVQVIEPLTSGIPHTLDMRTGILRVGGSRVYAKITTSEYWSVAPGARQTLSASAITTGTATVRLNYLDTYI